jgi:hypothetical protein
MRQVQKTDFRSRLEANKGNPGHYTGVLRLFNFSRQLITQHLSAFLRRHELMSRAG